MNHDNPNVSMIQHEIQQKIKCPQPYFPPSYSVSRVHTDMNVFPYTRYFRGRQNSMSPYIFDREAGYSPICEQTTTKKTNNQSLLLADVCFQMPCSTRLPCQKGTFQSNVNQCVYCSP